MIVYENLLGNKLHNKTRVDSRKVKKYARIIGMHVYLCNAAGGSLITISRRIFIPWLLFASNCSEENPRLTRQIVEN